jgi:hypothetical protein
LSSKPLTTPSLLDLLDLFEQSAQPITDIDGQRLYGVPGWDLSRRTDLSDRELAAWTECVGYAGYYPAPCGDEHVLVEIEEDADPGRYRYRSPETFRVKYIPTETAVVRAVTATKLLNYLADLLDIPRALRRGITTAAIDGVLWHLGKIRIGQIHVDVWLARGLATRIDAVFQHFGLTALPDTGIILTAGPALSAMIRPPRNYRIIPLTSVLTAHSAAPLIDTDLIRRLLLAAHGETTDRSPAVRFDESTNTLHITTRVIEPWTITGSKQIAVVKYLVEQFHNERHRVSAGDILVAAYGSRAAARNKRVASIFSGNTRWLDYIVLDENGYGIQLE